MTQSADIDINLCPLCGLSNNCTLANPATATQPCWCFAVTISSEVLAQVPAELRNQACLCPACAQALTNQASDAS